MRVGRRALLQAAAALLAAEAAGALEPAPTDAGLRGPRTPSAGAPLSPDELDDLAALAGILVAEGPLAPDEREHVLDHVRHRAAAAAHHASVYRQAVRRLERLGGARFAALSPRRQLDLVRRHLGSPALPPADAARGDAGSRALVIAARDLIAGYYRSPAGWAAVGAGAYPGRCGDLDRYTRPEA
jgi:hypothetical protein